MAKQFVFYGKSEEELKKMDAEEFTKLLPARQRRKLKRGLTDTQKKLLRKLKKKREKPVRTKARNMIIVPEMIGVKLEIYSGRDFVPVMIKTEMLGHYLGEFVLTRKRVGHGSAAVVCTRRVQAATLQSKY